jgi:malate dehydrogenase
MPTSIAIIGASGAVGTMLAAQLLRSDLLEASDRLQLVGHGASTSEAKLLGTRIDLLDAFDDERIDVEMVPNISDVDADIVVVAAGLSLSQQCPSRRDLGVMNRKIFEHIAEVCARRVPKALFILVSNPVELAVQIFASKIERSRVMGMGAQQDSLRFARAIARDLGITRRRVRASVMGEHGQAMVPIWSTVELLVSNPALHALLKQLQEKSEDTPLRERVASLRSKVVSLLEHEKIPEAYETARCALPDARIFVEPFITYHCLHSTPNATSNATLQCIEAALASDGRSIHGQVVLEGEILGLHGVCGVPLALTPGGWQCRASGLLNSGEHEMIADSIDSIRSFTSMVLSQPAAETVAVPG